MGFGSSKIIAAIFLLACFRIDFGASSIDTITSSQFIKDPEFVVSPGNTFKLGFFSPVNSTNRYVGIWYNENSMFTPIWIANRNKPLKDSSGIMKVYEDGNLVVLNGNGEILWSSSVSTRVDNSTAELNDMGDLVLRDNDNENIIWQSFQHPGDSFVSGMKAIANQGTQEKILLTSWKDPSDPSIGSFSAGVDVFEIPQIFIWKGNRPYWRSGQWNGRTFTGVPDMSSGYLDGFFLEGDRSSGKFSFRFTYMDRSHPSIFVLSPEGKVIQKTRTKSSKSWQIVWQPPQNECDIYGMCGEFGVCNPKNSPVCSCLKGFEPKNADEWSRGNWTGGCVRSRLLQCERIKTGDEAGKCDKFSRLEAVKMPDLAHWSSSLEEECKFNCLNNCSCIAYSYYSDVGCMSWTGNLIDIQKFSSGGADLYIRLAYSEFNNNRNLKVIIGIAVVIGAIKISIFAFFIWRWMAKYGERRNNWEMLLVERNEYHPIFLDVNMLIDSFDQVKLQELRVFNLQKLALATGNFDVSNKLGQGGFGPVYKGNLGDRQEIAVKRLSRASGQGLDEFMNEVVLISKLQHRNLVRLFGCCVEGEEKMLVYEYMPNKSLDAFLFDPSKKQVLDWRKRFHIIGGICRGLLYLHRDSRLRIIHRDLKASNILLDQELNPKISDFGMAQIFGGNEDQANTRTVVGTYGYMSPEYAMEGRFSEKSDVFSFGVLLLEIVSGRRNTSFYENEQALSLPGFAWKLWNEGNIVGLVDPVVSNPCYQTQILRCLHAALLCVQEFAKDRPTVSTVISMLNSEIVDLPIPKQPAFTGRKFAFDDSGSCQQSPKNCSVNLVTLSDVDAR